MSDPTVTWNVVGLQCYEDFGGYQDVVRTVHWRCEASGPGEDGLPATAQRTGSTTVPVDEVGVIEPFTAFDNLTEDQVLAWVWGRINVAEVDSGVRRDWQLVSRPAVVDLPLPWADNNE